MSDISKNGIKINIDNKKRLSQKSNLLGQTTLTKLSQIHGNKYNKLRNSQLKVGFISFLKYYLKKK